MWSFLLHHGQVRSGRSPQSGLKVRHHPVGAATRRRRPRDRGRMWVLACSRWGRPAPQPPGKRRPLCHPGVPPETGRGPAEAEEGRPWRNRRAPWTLQRPWAQAPPPNSHSHPHPPPPPPPAHHSLTAVPHPARVTAFKLHMRTYIRCPIQVEFQRQSEIF